MVNGAGFNFNFMDLFHVVKYYDILKVFWGTYMGVYSVGSRWELPPKILSPSIGILVNSVQNALIWLALIKLKFSSENWDGPISCAK